LVHSKDGPEGTYYSLKRGRKRGKYGKGGSPPYGWLLEGASRQGKFVLGGGAANSAKWGVGGEKKPVLAKNRLSEGEFAQLIWRVDKG